MKRSELKSVVEAILPAVKEIQKLPGHAFAPITIEIHKDGSGRIFQGFTCFDFDEFDGMVKAFGVFAIEVEP